MATAKTKFARMKQTAERLDWLMANARILRSPALWEKYYEALRIVIGEGEGRNWWCVAFPPLCLGAASETVDTAAQAGYFTPGQAALVTGENEGYVLKFKTVELWEKLKARLAE